MKFWLLEASPLTTGCGWPEALLWGADCVTDSVIGPGTQMVSETVCVLVPEAAVAVTVNEVVLAAALAAMVSVSVEVPAPVTLAGLKAPVTPAGSPLTASAVACAAPALTVVVTEYVAVAPAVAVCAAGVSARVKSG